MDERGRDQVGAPAPLTYHTGPKEMLAVPEPSFIRGPLYPSRSPALTAVNLQHELTDTLIQSSYSFMISV